MGSNSSKHIMQWNENAEDAIVVMSYLDLEELPPSIFCTGSDLINSSDARDIEF